MTIIVILVVSGALVAGAAWGVYGSLSEATEGFIVALAGGALIVSAVLELIEPSIKEVPVGWGLAVVLAGALVFAGLDYLVDEVWSSGAGGGLLAAITLDGVPENLALGVSLIGADPMAVAALSGSILLSNLPEAAGGARRMSQDGTSDGETMWLWGGAAVLLSGAALAGHYLLADVPEEILMYIRCFAGGAVVGSLAIEVFPKAFKQDNYVAGVAAGIGLCVALYLDTLG
ncbi:ZIP family metal transporter [Lewinella sp. IMCC34183]|uniref:ZIP family metal transporter n=1 Tax=Lewinella sp. IMCC34183 TaxID=2248762 RepID=UPI000E260CB2|nr:zinc transporter [Lewinella sp. IMCC34183]